MNKRYIKGRKPLTVTVGIPAYNEGQNILNLLNSILKQKGKFFKLEKIIVICDGCTDDTAEKVKLATKKSSFIYLILGKKRLGKAKRLNQLFNLNKSKIILTQDGDTAFKSSKVLETLIKGFNNEKIVVVGANNQPIKAITLTEKIYNVAYRIWYEIRKDYLNGHNVSNFQGMSMGLEKSFAKSFKIPPTSGDGPFICIMAKRQNKQYRFIKKAVIFFHSIDNLYDFFVQATRNISTKDNLAKYFGKQIYKESHIPIGYKIRGILKTLAYNPCFTILAIILNICVRILVIIKGQPVKSGVWKIAKSTKKRVIIK